MRWFFPSAAAGAFVLAGSLSLHGQGTSATGQGAATIQRRGVDAQGAGSVSVQRVDARQGARAHVEGNSGGSGYFPEDNEPWFANNNLRDELELDDDQIERLTEIYNQTRAELQGRNTGDQLSDEARAKRMRELRDQFDDQFDKRSADVFRNENQRSRFNQLGVQYRGYSAFDNPRLQRELNLNETQLRQLRDLNNSWNTELETLRGTYAGNRTGTEQRFNQLRDRTRTNFEGILNDQQRTAYDEMIGNRFDFGADTFLGGNANNPNSRPPGNGNQGSLLGTQQQPGGQGSGIGTPQDNGPQGSGIGTPQDNGPQGSGIGTPSGAAGGVGAGGGTGTSGSGGAGSGSSASGSSS